MTASLPLQPQPLSAAIADRLRQRILQGEWATGIAIHATEIASRLGVSPAPVREAFKLLCHEGLLYAQGRSAMHVTVLSPAQIQEAQACARLAAKTCGSARCPGGWIGPAHAAHGFPTFAIGSHAVPYKKNARGV